MSEQRIESPRISKSTTVTLAIVISLLIASVTIVWTVASVSSDFAERLGRIETSLAAIEARLGKVETGVDRVNENSTKVTVVEAKCEINAVNIEKVERRIEELERALLNHKK